MSPLPTVALLACVLLARTAQATTVLALSEADLARGARTIVHGRVLSKTSFVTPQGRIYTEYRFAVTELLKGAASPDGTVTFREWGGTVGGTTYWLPGVRGYEVGEEVVAFLGEHDPRYGVGFTYGLAQGKFSVKRDLASGRFVAVRDLRDLRLVARAGGRLVSREPGDPAGGVELGGLLGRIRAELAR